MKRLTVRLSVIATVLALGGAAIAYTALRGGDTGDAAPDDSQELAQAGDGQAGSSTVTPIPTGTSSSTVPTPPETSSGPPSDLMNSLQVRKVGHATSDRPETDRASTIPTSDDAGGYPVSNADNPDAELPAAIADSSSGGEFSAPSPPPPAPNYGDFQSPVDSNTQPPSASAATIPAPPPSSYAPAPDATADPLGIPAAPTGIPADPTSGMGFSASSPLAGSTDSDNSASVPPATNPVIGAETAGGALTTDPADTNSLSSNPPPAAPEYGTGSFNAAPAAASLSNPSSSASLGADPGLAGTGPGAGRSPTNPAATAGDFVDLGQHAFIDHHAGHTALGTERHLRRCGLGPAEHSAHRYSCPGLCRAWSATMGRPTVTGRGD